MSLVYCQVCGTHVQTEFDLGSNIPVKACGHTDSEEIEPAFAELDFSSQLYEGYRHGVDN